MTKYEKMREEKIAWYQSRIGINPGAIGKIEELRSVTSSSRKTAVALQGEADIYIHIGSKRSNVPAERKTNGGRIGSLRKPDAPRYVVYSMRFVQKHKAGKHTEAYDEVREIDPVLIPTAVFLAALDRFHATKSTNGRNPEEAIQVSSKKFFEWLLDWPIPYTPGTVYTEDDFEGLA